MNDWYNYYTYQAQRYLSAIVDPCTLIVWNIYRGTHTGKH